MKVVASQTRTNIRRLTRTFITLSLADLASRVGLATPQEVGNYFDATKNCSK